MSFVQGTRVLTDSGFKNIEEISGNDRVLIRNFLGRAEFIQPFYIIKKHYNGNVNSLAGRYWKFSVTPDHKLTIYGKHQLDLFAKDIIPGEMCRLAREVKLQSDDTNKYTVSIRKPKKRVVTFSQEDWYTILAYVITRGSIVTSGKNKQLMFLLKKSKRDQMINEIFGIFLKYGIKCSINNFSEDYGAIAVDPHNSLARKLIKLLGSQTRRDMILPDSVVYESSRKNIQIFIDTMLRIKSNGEPNISITISNKDLANSLIRMGNLGGYGVGIRKHASSGSKFLNASVKRDIYKMEFSSGTKYSSVTSNESLHYDGFVYDVDLLYGDIYVSDGTVSVWVSPK